MAGMNFGAGPMGGQNSQSNFPRSVLLACLDCDEWGGADGSGGAAVPSHSRLRLRCSRTRCPDQTGERR